MTAALAKGSLDEVPMIKKYNVKLVPLARQLRKDMTKEESFLWYEFLRKYPVKFTRQKILGKYIADFYCPRVKLVIEIDGKTHLPQQAQEYDKERTEFLEKYGITVIRFFNGEITVNFDTVCSEIDAVVKDMLADNPTL